MYIVLIETSGNQHYIFATNKLRENVGASELTYQVGTKYVLEAIGKTDVVKDDLDGSKLRSFLLDKTQNQPIEKDTSNDAVEVVIATSGKAILLVRDEKKAKRIVSEVTKNALMRMPGLTVHGAIETVEGNLRNIHDAVGKVHSKLETVRYRIPSNQQRFLRLPFAEPCATSGLPAVQMYRHESLKGKPDESKPHSALSRAKQETSNDGHDRLENIVKSVSRTVRLVGNINELETKWIAVIHADGNGLGELFLKFAHYLDITPNSGTNLFDTTEGARMYIDTYRKFSLALDSCTINAAGKAIAHFQSSYNTHQQRKEKGASKIPFIPLILGGDDLTVICDGEYALKFTHDFLTQLEKQVSENDVIKPIVQKAFNVDRLGICAGVAIIKPHYPFHQAYELAEKLLQSAKQVKKKVRHDVQRDGKVVKVMLPCSAIDFHVVYDSTVTDLDIIRAKLTVDGDKTRLFAKPYVVTKDLTGQEENEWLNRRKFSELDKRVKAMLEPALDDATRRALPNSKLHEIRQALFFGKTVATIEATLIKNRLGKDAAKHFSSLEAGESLFFNENGKAVTHFLDALEALDFWKGLNKEGAAAPAEDSDTEEETSAKETTQ